MDLKKTFGKNMRYYRFLRGYTQEEFAKKTFSSVTYISNIENGKNSPSFTKIEIFSKILDVPTKYLFDSKINNFMIEKDIRKHRNKKE